MPLPWPKAASNGAPPITYASRDSVFDGVEIRQGDYLALVNGSLGYTGADFDEVCAALNPD